MALSLPPRIVAVIDSDPDSMELLKTVLEVHGMVAATGNLNEFRLGKASLLDFLQRTAPDVIVYDLGLPYEANYRFLQKSMEDLAFPRCGIVLTTTNARAVQTLLGVRAMEILGKPFDLEMLVQAVRTALPPGHAAAEDRSARTEPGGSERREQERRTGRDRRTPDLPPSDSLH
jgi:DNA-binding NarL/FixJ family response regulator